MLWIGITGPMGSGKSTVAGVLRQMNFEVIDADEAARKVLSPGTPCEAEVLRTFGQQILDKDGHLDRRALGRVVFADSQKLAQLEAIIHPHVRDEVAQQKEKLKNAGHVAAFYDVPLLFEKKMQAQFDFILTVKASEELRRKRLKTRSGITDQEIDERNSQHLPPRVKEASASAVINNSGTPEDLNEEVLRVLKKLKIPLPAAADT